MPLQCEGRNTDKGTEFLLKKNKNKKYIRNKQADMQFHTSIGGRKTGIHRVQGLLLRAIKNCAGDAPSMICKGTFFHRQSLVCGKKKNFRDRTCIRCIQ